MVQNTFSFPEPVLHFDAMEMHFFHRLQRIGAPGVPPRAGIYFSQKNIYNLYIYVYMRYIDMYIYTYTFSTKVILKANRSLHNSPLRPTSPVLQFAWFQHYLMSCILPRCWSWRPCFFYGNPTFRSMRHSGMVW